MLVGYSRAGYRLRRHSWPADDPRRDALAGRTALVTGASSGIGMAAAAGLARLGARVVLVVRDEDRGNQARNRILRQVPRAELVVARCDVADLDDVTRFAAEARAQWPTVDLLVHNAGVLPAKRQESRQGHEITLATHVLGPMLLTERLRPALAASADARVVFVSSGGMYTQSVPAGDVDYRQGRFRGAVAYARTKRLQVAFTTRLAARYARDGIAVHAMHPGWADTPGITNSLPIFRRITKPLLRDATEGADTIVWLAATQPPPPSGRFWHDRRERPAHYLPGRHDNAEHVHRAWLHCSEAARLNTSQNG
ncbi:dehydrogenase [Kibdelosporangium phytohabitans]|uniref:Dehydrogenase n=1 Tax=Kibdelosporangium phytohabitans TaxID=860235 RepID=A0A0N9IIR0_9PSEU|nr:dehydrogenase [Kibdelosporangium phytohabitans]